MRAWKSIVIWSAVFATVVMAGVLLFLEGLSQAALWATALGLPVAVIGSAAGVWSAVLAVRTLWAAPQPQPMPARPPKQLKEEHVEIVDASIDHAVEIVFNSPALDGTSIAGYQPHSARIPRISESIDFKCVNRGDAAAFFTGLYLEVLAFTLDPAPVFSFRCQAHVPDQAGEPRNHRSRGLKMVFANHGWGDALDVEARVTCDVLRKLYSEPALTFRADAVGSGADQAFHVLASDADESTFRRLIMRRKVALKRTVAAMRAVDHSILGEHDFNLLLSHHEQWHAREFFEDSRDPRRATGPRQAWHIEYMAAVTSDQIPIQPTVDLTYTDGDGRQTTEQHEAFSRRTRMDDGVLWIGPKGFFAEISLIMYAPAPARDVFSVILDPDGPRERRYALSRVIEPGGADRFHILVTGQKSGQYRVRFKFAVNSAGQVRSEPFVISLRRPRNVRLPTELADGASFELSDGRLELGGERSSDHPWRHKSVR